jgi:endogenous inhibitor of DNA gyrase (YacG/DUF329 family)
MPRCPVCDDSVDLATTPTIPFCSDRCRLIELQLMAAKPRQAKHAAAAQQSVEA